jgi:hypothetical protein
MIAGASEEAHDQVGWCEREGLCLSVSVSVREEYHLIWMHAATANTAAEQAPTSIKQMETLPPDVLQSLIQRREADAATALTPRVVEASKHRFTIVCVCDVGRGCAFSRWVIFGVLTRRGTTVGECSGTP